MPLLHLLEDPGGAEHEEGGEEAGDDGDRQPQPDGAADAHLAAGAGLFGCHGALVADTGIVLGTSQRSPPARSSRPAFRPDVVDVALARRDLVAHCGTPRPLAFVDLARAQRSALRAADGLAVDRERQRLARSALVPPPREDSSTVDACSPSRRYTHGSSAGIGVAGRSAFPESPAPPARPAAGTPAPATPAAYRSGGLAAASPTPPSPPPVMAPRGSVSLRSAMIGPSFALF